jgi:hypothetical protein
MFIRLLLLSCDWFIRRLSVSIIESVENWTFYSTGSRFFARLPLAFVIWSCVALVFVSYSYLVPCGSWIPVRMFLVWCPVVDWCDVLCVYYLTTYTLLLSHSLLNVISKTDKAGNGSGNEFTARDSHPPTSFRDSSRCSRYNIIFNFVNWYYYSRLLVQDY